MNINDTYKSVSSLKCNDGVEAINYLSIIYLSTIVYPLSFIYLSSIHNQSITYHMYHLSIREGRNEVRAILGVIHEVRAILGASRGYKTRGVLD